LNVTCNERQHDREIRLEAYRKTGRIIQVAPQGTAREDLEGEEHAPLSARERNRSRRKKGMDRFLFIVEITAIIGLLFIFLNGVKLMRNLNTEVASALEQPTLTPTALYNAVVLPGGHNPPVEGVENSFNESEIPEHLRPLMQSYAAIPIPTPRPQQARQIQIPVIDLNAPVVLGDGWEQLKKGVGQNLNSADPGQQGNLVLSAHNDIFGEYFRDLDRLEKGDEIIIITQDRSFTYLVTRKLIVEPGRVDLMGSTEKSTITLISCYPYLVDNKRIVIQGTLQQ
jgi:sortase A